MGLREVVAGMMLTAATLGCGGGAKEEPQQTVTYQFYLSNDQAYHLRFPKECEISFSLSWWGYTPHPPVLPLTRHTGYL